MKAQNLLFAILVLSLLNSRAEAVQDRYQPPEYHATNGEFDAVGQSVLELLQTKDAAQFAARMAISREDWNFLMTTNLTEEEKDGARHDASNGVRSAAELLVSRANSLHLNFSNNWRVQVVLPKSFGWIFHEGGQLKSGEEAPPYLQSLDVILFPAGSSLLQTNNCFKIALAGVIKYPTGWRVSEGVRWKSFPTNLIDKKFARELAIQDKMTTRKPITAEDDPTLLELGKKLIEFIRQGNIKFYDRDIMTTPELQWAEMQKRKEKEPSLETLKTQAEPMLQKQRQNALAILKQTKDAGIDLTKADMQIKSASFKYAQLANRDGTLDGLRGEQFVLKFGVKSNEKSKTGVLLNGDYTLAADRIAYFENGWRIAKQLRWKQLPDGVMDNSARTNLEFENYVAENRTLPPQTIAPEIEFITLDGDEKMKLSDLRGKVVLLDFWATWCGPCQRPMADLQTIRQSHTDWGDKVAIVSVSIDNSMNIVRKHVEKRDWTNTFNVWAGKGGWTSTTANTFRISSVPTTYVLDKSGKIAFEGYPFGTQVADAVDSALK